MGNRLSKIRAADLILDVGSGNKPHPRANVICDRYVEGQAERSGPIIVDRPFVVADAHYLPFKDKAFDYVIASHILEHMDDPALFLSELSRVASRGYIESPSEVSEKLFFWPYHKWYVMNVSNVLVIKEKNFPATFGSLFHHLYARDRLFKVFVDHNPSIFLTSYEWEGTIRYDFTAASEKTTIDLWSDGVLSALTASDRKYLRVKPLLKLFTPRWLVRAVKRLLRKPEAAPF
ncbi:MAG: class I SAM-dependent methyltransferase [Nitrospinota bacterium]